MSNARMAIIISDKEAMQEGEESFSPNKQCKKGKNHFRRTSNARMTKIISNEQAMQE
jgi:hypothetical protein